MGTGRRVFEFLKMASVAHARWDYEVSMSILKNRRKLFLLLAAILPILAAIGVEAGDILGGKTAYAPAFYSTNIFLISIAIGLCAGLITGCIGAGGGFIITPALMAAGVKGIRLKKGDEVIGMDVISENPKSEARNPKQYLLVVMENGYGKRTEVSQYKVQGRGGSGIKTANITAKTGGIVISSILEDSADNEDLIVISQKGQVIRTQTKSISLLGRATQGVRIMRLDAGDKVASGTCLKE